MTFQMRRGHKAKRVDSRLVGKVILRRVGKITKNTRPCAPCGGKLLHPTRAGAGKHLHRLSAVEPPESLARMHVYRCPVSSGYHVGHSTTVVPDVTAPSDRVQARRAAGESAS